MILTAIESILGIIIAGFFLNSMAIKISKDKEEKLKNKRMKKVCGLLESSLKKHLGTLKEMKSATSLKGKEVSIFSDEFIEEVVLLCGNAEFQQSNPKVSVARYFTIKFEDTQKEINDFINKFINFLDDEFLFLLNDFSESNAFGEVKYFENRNSTKKHLDIEIAKSMNIPEEEKRKYLNRILNKPKEPIPLFMEWIRTGNESDMPLEVCNFYTHIKTFEKIVIEVEKVLERKVEVSGGEWINKDYTIKLTDANPGVYLNYNGKLLY